MAIGRIAWHRWLLFWGIALGGAAFDLGAKAFVFDRMSLGERRRVLDDILEIRPTQNTGALWGLGRNWPHSGVLFAGLSIVAGCVILYYLFVRGAARDWRLTVALGLIMAGAMGNCHDRLTLGYVRDFVYFHVDSVRFECAIFNFADNMLVIGAAAIMILALRPDAAGDASENGEPTMTDERPRAEPENLGGHGVPLARE